MARVPESSRVRSVGIASLDGQARGTAQRAGQAAEETGRATQQAIRAAAQFVGNLRRRRGQAAFNSAVTELETELPPRLDRSTDPDLPPEIMLLPDPPIFSGKSPPSKLIPSRRNREQEFDALPGSGKVQGGPKASRKPVPDVQRVDKLPEGGNLFRQMEADFEDERRRLVADLSRKFQLDAGQIAELDQRSILVTQRRVMRAAASENNRQVEGFAAVLDQAERRLSDGVLIGSLSLDEAFQTFDMAMDNAKSFLPDGEVEERRIAGRRTIGLGALQALADAEPEEALALLASSETEPFSDIGLNPRDLDDLAVRAEKSLVQKRVAAANELTSSVASGEAGEADIKRARDEELIGDEKQAGLMKLVERRKAEAGRAEQAKSRVESARAGDLFLDPRSAEDRESVNLYYENVLLPELDALQPEKLSERNQRIVEFVQNTGLIPDQLQGLIRGRLRAGDEAAKIEAATMLDQFITRNSKLQDEFVSSDIQLGIVIAENMRLGLTAEKAVARAEKELLQVDPSERERRRQIVDGLTQQSVFSFPTRFTTASVLEADFPVRTELPGELVSNYELAFEKHFMATGDPNVASKLAFNNMRSLWGMTDIGERRWQKRPPEVVYKVDPDDDGTWIREQLVADMEKPGVKLPSGFSSLGASSDDLPEDMRLFLPPEELLTPKPRYRLQRRDKIGEWTTVQDRDDKPFEWRPDWKTSPEFRRRQEQLERQESLALERAKKMREKIEEFDNGPMFDPRSENRVLPQEDG